MSADTLRAFVEAVVPGLHTDATAGAPDIAADRYVGHYLGAERSEMLRARLDAAEERSFASGSIEERQRAIRAMRRDPGSRPLIDAAIALTVAAVYGSWSGRDDTGARVREPLGWGLAGFDGPSRSRLDELGR